jgi:hypothetical protein
VPKDFYKLLGIPHTATLIEIEAAYRRMSNLSYNLEPFAGKLYAQVTEAYEILKNPVTRSIYDENVYKKFINLEETSKISNKEGQYIVYQKTQLESSGNFPINPVLCKYFFRWKVPVAVVGSFVLIRYFSLQLFQDPSAAETYISWITGLFVFGGWILVWIVRFNTSIEKLMNRDIGGEREYIRLELKSYGKKAIEIVFALVCAAAYGFFLRFCVPYAPIRGLGRGNPMNLIWTHIYFVVFLISIYLT